MDNLDKNQWALLVHLQGPAGETIPSATRIAKDLGISDADCADDLVLLERQGLVHSIRPPSFEVANGRFKLSDNGRALLALNRKQRREAELRAWEPEVTKAPIGIVGSNAMREPKDKQGVFIVHGRDTSFANAMFDFVQSAGLKPIEWEAAVSLTGEASPYVGDVLDQAFRIAQAIMILMTPDNEGRLRPGLWKSDEPSNEREWRFHPRQNVIFEAGMAFAVAPRRTILVVPNDVMLASDIGGKNYVSFNGDASSRNRLLERLTVAGCAPDKTGSRWLQVGNFPTFSNLSVAKTQEYSQYSRQDHSADQPVLSLELHPGRGGPDGHFLDGKLENIGRSFARNVILQLPGISTSRVASLIKQGDATQLSIKYSDTDCFLSRLTDPTVLVEYENERGDILRQEGRVNQTLSPGGAIFLYSVDTLGPISFKNVRELVSQLP